MSDVKLFRVTEFAQSTFSSPLTHRNSIHPLWVMLIIAVWVATAGHWPLWHVFVRSDSQASWGLMASFGLQSLAGSLLLLALSCWRFTLKPAITLLLIWTTLGACQMIVLAESGQPLGVSPGGLFTFIAKAAYWELLLNWKSFFSILQIAVVPTALLWAGHVRRIPFNQNLAINAILLITSYGLLIWSRGQIGHSIPSVVDPLAMFSAWAR